MKRILICFFCLVSIAVYAQNARQILDKTAANIKQKGDVKVEFTATSFNGTEEQGQTKGTILLQGKKMQLSTADMKMWYNGKTQWSLITESGEVNVSNPTGREMNNMNPYSFLNLYKKGYKLKARQTKLRGKDVYEVHLVARSSNSNTQEIYVDVAKNDYSPLCIRVRHQAFCIRSKRGVLFPYRILYVFRSVLCRRLYVRRTAEEHH